MLSYDTQLSLKRNVIVKAYQNFSGTIPIPPPHFPLSFCLLPFTYRLCTNHMALTRTCIDLPPSSVPPILPTIGSPLQYGYRTKITPHFDTPARDLKKFGLPEDGAQPDWFRIGFNKIGTRHVMDIEVRPVFTTPSNSF